jgi:hydroxyethylthiazole kinase-like sugar kinase family protein
LARVAGLVSVGIAAGLAAARIDVKGPSSFKTAFLDELYNLNADKIREMIKIEFI